MKRVISILLIAILLLSGCSITHTRQDASVLTDGIYGQFNPLLAQSAGDKAVCSLLFDSLVEEGETGDIISGIADYEILDEGLRYRFKIKKNVAFSNGEPVKASDVFFTMRVLADKNYSGPVDLSKAGIRGFADFKSGKSSELSGFEQSDDAAAFSIHIDKKDDNFLHNLTFGILSEKYYGQTYENGGIEGLYALGNKPLGSGQYVLKSFDKKSAVFTANEAYFKGAPEIKDLTLKDSESGAKEFDVYETYHAGKLQKEIRGKGMVTRNVSDGDNYIMGFNCEDDFLGDGDVRRAIALAIDKEKISEKISGSFSGVPTLFGNLSQCDMAGAKEYLEKAGFTLGDEGIYQKDKKNLSISILMIEDEFCHEIFEVLSDNMKKLGVVVEAKFDAAAAEKIMEGEWQCFLLPLRESSSFLIADAFVKESEKNIYSFENEHFDALAEGAGGNALTAEMLEIINKEVPVLPLYEKVKTLVYNNSLSEIYFSPHRSVFRNMYSIEFNK